MPGFEYKVVPAPRKGQRIKGVKAAEDRFAHTLAMLINEHAAEGWEYQRTDTLPCEERRGLTGRTTVSQTVLVFRRARVETAGTVSPAVRAGPEPAPRGPSLGAAHHEPPLRTAKAPNVAAE